MSTPVGTEAKPRTPPAFLNNAVKFLLGSPLHSPFSKSLLLLTFKGRKSGKSYTIPVGYHQEGQVVTCVTDHTWWKNLLNNPEVSLRIKGRVVHGKAEVIHDDIEAVVQGLKKYFAHLPRAARAFSIPVDENKQPVEASLRAAAQHIAIVRIQLNA